MSGSNVWYSGGNSCKQNYDKEEQWNYTRSQETWFVIFLKLCKDTAELTMDSNQWQYKLIFFIQDLAQLSHVRSTLSKTGMDGPGVDVELYQRLIVTTWNIAESRPTNRVKFAEKIIAPVQTEQGE